MPADLVATWMSLTAAADASVHGPLAALLEQVWWVSAAAAAVGGWTAWALAARARRMAEARRAELSQRLSELAGARSPAPLSHAPDEDQALERLTQLVVESEAMKRVIDAIDAPMLALDETDRVWLANRAMLEVLERDSGEVLATRIDDLFTQSDLLALLRRAREGAPAQGRVRLVRRQRTFVYDASATRLMLAKRPGVVLTLRDVTELAQAVQLKTDFVGNASHELRTPVAAIRAAVDTLAGPARGDEPMRDRLTGMIREQVLRLEELISDLLDLSRLESSEFRLRFEDVDLEALCREVAQAAAPMCLERSLGIDVQIDASVRQFRTDRWALLLIVRNLVDNAVKFSHECSVVTIRGRLDGDELVMQVIDKGIGIPLSQQQRIFERFYQVDQARSGSVSRRGTGLGLAIVKHAIRRLGGSIDVHSVWQQGTTMTIRVPRAPERDDAGESGSEPRDLP